MIDRQEIADFSREWGLEHNVVEKDYVLGWVLAGLFEQPVLKSEWMFKGGTCLKKCFFETYRFSEDLDFTVKHPDYLREQFILDTFAKVASWIYEQSGIEIPNDTVRVEVYQNPRGRQSVQARVGYLGPLQRHGSIPRIKFDITDDERMVSEPVWRDVHHPYSDRPENGIRAQCYSYEELFAEKVRALAERMRPRDLYDVIHLYRHDELNPNRSLVVSIIKEKCAFKGIAVPTAESLQNKPERRELETEWANMLAHQLPQLPSIAQFFEELPGVFTWLFGTVAKPIVPSIPVGADADRAWLPPAMATSWGLSVPLEIIRFAAANHLCVDLAYQGRRRIIEPYSLRRTLDGNIVLHAMRHEGGEHRSYRVDKIEGANATDIPFVPKYAIELTAGGTLSVPSNVPRAGSGRRSSRSKSWGHGPTYVVECSVCGKRFNRTSFDTSLNPHKNKDGYPCYGRFGSVVETKY